MFDIIFGFVVGFAAGAGTVTFVFAKQKVLAAAAPVLTEVAKVEAAVEGAIDGVKKA